MRSTRWWRDPDASFCDDAWISSMRLTTNWFGMSEMCPSFNRCGERIAVMLYVNNQHDSLARRVPFSFNVTRILQVFLTPGQGANELKLSHCDFASLRLCVKSLLNGRQDDHAPNCALSTSSLTAVIGISSCSMVRVELMKMGASRVSCPGVGSRP